MKKVTFILGISIAVFALSVMFISCKKDRNREPDAALQQEPALPEEPYDYSSKHGVNSSLATLGRVLFYDRNLSVNNAVSCGSCHKQQYAFADNVKVNKGFNGLDLKRNSPSIQGIRSSIEKGGLFDPINPNQPNTRGGALLFWDGRQNSVKDMVLNPVLNHNEMNVPDFETLISKLNTIGYYRDLFTDAFGDPSISKERLALALEGFIACLNTTNPANSFNSSSVFTTTLTGLAEQGRQLFHNKYNCAKCHDPSNTGSYGAVTSPTQMFNIGLDEIYADNGLGAITRKEGDKGLFKVPTLKNISLTAPYMHDGRFATLSEVIDHYSHEIKPNQNLSSLFLNFDGTPKKLSINASEKSALITFLNTLKDEDFLTSPMYADPFQN